MPQYEVGSEEYWAAERAKEEENRQVLIAEQGEDVVNRNPRTWKLPAENPSGVTLPPNRRLTQTGDRMPGQEYELMSLQQSVAMKERQATLFKDREKEGWTMQYTPGQEAEKRHLLAGKEAAYKEYGEHKLTEDQLGSMLVELERRDRMIRPSQQKPRPTITQQVEASTYIDPTTGSKHYVIRDENGNIKGLKQFEGNVLSGKELIGMAEDIRTAMQNEALEILDAKGQGTGKYEPVSEEAVAAAVAAQATTIAKIRHFMSGGDGGADMQPQGQPGQPPPPAGGTIGRQGQGTPPPEMESQSALYSEMTPEQQKLADEKYAQEERIRVGRERMGGARVKGLPKEEWDTKKMTDREIAGMYSDARRPGALPPNWEKATEKEQDIMLENANDRLKPGEKLFTKYTLGQKVDREPTSIPFLLKSKGTKVAAQSMVSPNEKQDAYNWAKANPNDPRSKRILEKLGKE